MDRVGRGRGRGLGLGLTPAAVIVLFAVYDVVTGPGRVVLGLLVVSPLLAATILGRGTTVFYAVLALAVAALLGIYDQQYAPDTLPTQAVRLFGILLGGVIAIAACGARLEREYRLREISAAAAAAEARDRDSRPLVGLAERMQRSLLRDPAHLQHLDVEVRYLPATEHIQVGGDWYDAFPAPDGRTMLVIGDVAGHDGAAAATMAQVRNVLRGITQVLPAPPAAVLSALDQALRTLSVPALATVILAEVQQRHTPAETLVLRWSNAGHPPPLLICADGAVQLLDSEPELLLGVDPGTRRSDHELELGAGDTVVFYTDGLVERRGSAIDDGLQWIQDTAATAAAQPLEQLCDTLLGRVLDRADDDVAVLALRARVAPPRDHRSPSATGATRPADLPTMPAAVAEHPGEERPALVVHGDETVMTTGRLPRARPWS